MIKRRVYTKEFKIEAVEHTLDSTKTVKEISYGMKQSMSSKGNCYDNAVAESFFKTLKTELIYLKKGGYKSRVEAKREIFEYIECFYNSKRLHSALGYNSPKEYLERYYRGYFKCA